MATKGAIRIKKQRDLAKSFTLLAAIIGSVMLLFEGAFWVAGLSLLILSVSMRFVLTLTSGKTAVSNSAAERITNSDDAETILQIPARIFEQPVAQDIATDAPVARALELIIDEAVKVRASEIHFHPQEDKLMVEYHTYGSFLDTLALPLMVATPLISHIKVLANMDIACCSPQKGQFLTRARDRDIVCKVATTSTKYGEKVVLLLSPETPLEVSRDIGKQISDLLSKHNF